MEQLLPAGDFESLKAALSAHPLRHRSNGINDVTSGWSMVFTADGLAKMCGSPLFQVGHFLGLPMHAACVVAGARAGAEGPRRPT